MNAEAKKMIEETRKEPPKRTIRKWWNKNGYKVNRVIFFPLWLGMVANQKIQKKLDEHTKWSEERTIEILNHYVPSDSDWDEKHKCIWYFNNGCGWSLTYAKRHIKRKDYRYWRCHQYAIRDYLINTYEMEGFEKEVNNEYGETNICFYLKEDEENEA